MAANVQTIRFRRPEKKDAPTVTKPTNRHSGILQDQLRRSVLDHAFLFPDSSLSWDDQLHSAKSTNIYNLVCVCRAQRAPWVPSWATAFRLILLMRFTGAMYSNIQDCDEGMSQTLLHARIAHDSTLVFNFWEPLHYLDRGHGFQTWETSPKYSIRSWAYILLHIAPVKLATFFLGTDKVRLRAAHKF